MTTRGPKPKRQEITKHNGSETNRPSRAKELVPVTDKRPEPPIIVQGDELTLALWNETCDALQGMRFLCAEDKQLIESYVLNYRELILCAEEMHKCGNISATNDGGTRPSGASVNWARLMGLHLKLLQELGLTPSARARLAAPASRSKSEKTDVGNLLKKLSGG